jgi:ATP-dependent DNA helicase
LISNAGTLGFRFTPSLSSIIYHGDKAARAEIRRKHMPKIAGPGFPIVVTSYEMAMWDAKFLALYKWKYVVVDEVMEKKKCSKL